MKTHEPTEDAEEYKEKCGDILSARVDDDPTSLISFGNIAKPLASKKYIGDALVNEGAKPPKPLLPSKEVRMLSSVAGGLLLAGTTFTRLRTIFSPPPLLWSFCEKTKKRGNDSITTTTRHTNSDQFAPPFHRKVIEKKKEAKYDV